MHLDRLEESGDNALFDTHQDVICIDIEPRLDESRGKGRTRRHSYQSLRSPSQPLFSSSPESMRRATSIPAASS
jgi:hypothetical protein